MSDDAQIVRDALTRGAHKGGHHPRCVTGVDKGCDCYARASYPARAALDRLEAERNEARQWYFDNFASDEDEPPVEDLTLAQMIERVFSWGDSAWGQAGAQHERAVAAEDERDRLREALERIRDNVGWGDYFACACIAEPDKGHATCACAGQLRRLAREALKETP